MTVLLRNKQANFDYEILDTFEAGIKLLGFEVKSVKLKHGSLKSSHIIVNDDGVFLVNAHIPPFQVNNTPTDYNPYRKRQLLLTKKEMAKLIGKEKEKGLTLIPIKLYNVRNLVKVEFAVARGKKKYDKREALKKKAAKRDVERTLKNR